MRWILFILLTMAASVLEAGNLLNLIAFGYGQVRPSILLVLLVFFALRTEPMEAVGISFLLGFAADLAGPVMGPNTICWGVAGSLLAQMQGLLNVRHSVYQIAVVLAAALVLMGASHGLAVLKTEQTGTLPLRILLGRAFYTAAIVPFLWPLLERLRPLLKKPQPGRSSGIRLGHV
jgi:cell shape-determining protein MreD